MTRPARTARVQVSDLAVTYGAVVALREINLAVPPGCIVAVTGASGAGKTTLLWAIAGALASVEGTVHVDGTRVTDRQQSAGLGVAMVPQGNALASALTARENVLVPLLAAGVDVVEAASRANRALEELGLDEHHGHLVDELSGGQQQRVAIARGLAARAGVLLADEPTSDLDAGNRVRVVAALRRQADDGAAVVMTTHDPEASAEADAEVALDEGRMRWRRPLP